MTAQRGRQAEGWGTAWCRASWGATLLAVLSGLASPPAPAEETVDLAALVAKAEGLVAAKDWAGASAAWQEAVAAATDAYEEVEEQAADAIRALGTQPDTPSDAYFPALRERLAPLAEPGRLLAGLEIAWARSETARKGVVVAAHRLSRALAHDPGRLAEIEKDPALASLRKDPLYAELTLRMEQGRAHLDVGDPVETEFRTWEFRRCLRLEMADPELAGATRLTKELRHVVRVRLGAPIPDQLDVPRYDALTRFSLFEQERSWGWPLLHRHLWERDDAIAAIADATYRRFQESRERPDGPYRAYCAYFPAIHMGRPKAAREALDYLGERSVDFCGRALRGLEYLIRNLDEAGESLPGLTREETKALEAERKQRVRAIDVEKSCIDAWAGSGYGMISYGLYVVNGFGGLTADGPRGLRWVEAAEEMGVKEAEVPLAGCLLQGRGVPRDPPRALALLRRHVEAGEPDALNAIGFAHHYGIGVERDYAKAHDWFQKAAEKGHATAMDSLGILHHRAQGRDRDFAGARTWYEKAKAAGRDGADWRLAILALDSRATPEDLAHARTLLAQEALARPDDIRVLAYQWAAARLAGKPDEAKALAKAFLARAQPTGPAKDLATALTKVPFDPAPVLKSAAAIPDEKERGTQGATANYLAGVQALATKNPAKARTFLEKAVAVGDDELSPLHSAKIELERLK